MMFMIIWVVLLLQFAELLDTLGHTFCNFQWLFSLLCTPNHAVQRMSRPNNIQEHKAKLVQYMIENNGLHRQVRKSV